MGGVIPLEETQAGDYLLYDKTTQNLFFISHQATLEQLQAYSLDLYDYIGIVYIPASHDVYGDGSCCVCFYNGLFSMSSCIFGPENTDIPGIDFFDEVPYSGYRNNPGNENGSLIGIANWGHSPSDFYLTADYVDNPIQCPHDLNACYASDTNNYLLPSPYLTDGSRNPSYYQTTPPSSAQNCLSDFNGIGNTKKILESGLTYEEYEAAYDCYRLSGSRNEKMCQIIQEGDFYLPSAGELGYLLARKNVIDNSTTNIYTIYNPGISFGETSVFRTNWDYWTSTERNVDGVVSFDPTWGNCSNKVKEYKGTPTSVVPSIRINANGIVRI